MAHPVDVFATYPALRDVPHRYPDARPQVARQAYVYHRRSTLTLRTDGVDTVDATTVDGLDGPALLGAWLKDIGAAPIAQRIPMLAVGSNAYPRQLADKFLDHPLPDDNVVVLGCSVRDMRIAFCASLSTKQGYVPVTVRHAPGQTTHTWLQWLTPDQLTVIAATEGDSYALVECAAAGNAITLHGVAERVPVAYAWFHRAVLHFDGRPLHFAGAPPAGYPGDSGGVEEAELLGRVVARFLRATGATWTGDRSIIPLDRRETVGDFLVSHGSPNVLPPIWTRIDRRRPDFAQRLRPS